LIHSPYRGEWESTKETFGRAELPQELREVFQGFGYGCLAVETDIGVAHICHAADAETGANTAEQRFAAAGDLIARLFAEEKRQGILAAAEWKDVEPAGDIMILSLRRHLECNAEAW
jgi:hypothetical protein